MKQNKVPKNEYIRVPSGKTNPYKDDVIYDPRGQWAFPGQVTRIPGGDITMSGVPYPMYGEDDLGYGQMMYPGMDYTFPGQYVTEYPQMQIGGLLKKGLKAAKEAVKNTYKINPWAFKPNPEAYYHRSPNLENIINQEKRTLQGFGESEAGKMFTEKALKPSQGINLQKGANSKLYFAKGTPLDYGRTNKVLDKKTGKMIPGQGYPGPYIVEVEGVPMGVSTKGAAPGAEPTIIGSYAVSKRPVSLDEAKFYKEDWLRGYKPIKIPYKAYGGDPSLPNITGHYQDGGMYTKTHTHMQKGGWLDELDEEYRRGGSGPYTPHKLKKKSREQGTSKNIQSSINKIFARNYDIFGPSGRGFYNPNSKYQEGGQKSWEEMTSEEKAAYLDAKEKKKPMSKAQADAWAKQAEAKSRAQAKKEYYTDWVAQNYEQGAMNPLFQTVAGFSPLGVIPYAMQSGASALNNLGQGNLIEAGIDAVFSSPLLKNLKSAKKVVQKTKPVISGKMEDAVKNIKNKAAQEKIDTYNAIQKLKADRPKPSMGQNKFLSGERKISKQELDFTTKYPPTEGAGFYDYPADPNYLYNFKTYSAKPLEEIVTPYRKKLGGWLDNLD